MRVWRSQAQVKERVLYSISEMSGNITLGVNNADITTLECALLERMYYCKVKGAFEAPPLVTTGLYSTRLSTFTAKLRRILKTAAPISLDNVVEMYSGRKKSIYANAKTKYERYGLTRKHGNLNSFVKLEKVNPSKAPRCIQPRNSVYNVLLATFIKPIEHRVYDAIRKIYGDGPTVIKGYNVQQIGAIVRGKWRSFENPVAIGLDATKFDMHVSVEALEWEHSVYNGVYRSKTLSKMLRWQVENKGFGWCKDGFLRYEVRGRRASGDMNTSLGNCLIMCALVYEYALHRGVQIKLCNNGDDCVVMMERRDERAFMDGLDNWFLEMGFRMVAEEPVYDLNHIEFCQMRPIELDTGECVMVRNVPTALRKDSLCTVDIRNLKARKGWLSAVGKGGLALTGGIPVAQNFYRACVRLGEGYENKIATHLQRLSGMGMMSVGMAGTYSEPSANVRLQVFKAWGISPDMQLAFEKHMDDFCLSDAPVSAVDTHLNFSTIFHALSR
jgi:hypothetical protein